MISFARVEASGPIIEVTSPTLIAWEEGVTVNKKRESNNGFSFMAHPYKEAEASLSYRTGVGYT